MNVEPRLPDDGNGSDWIVNHVELSRALRQCAALRKRFLDYFLDGALVRDCLLAKGCAGATVGGYVLPGRAILIVLNTSGKRQSFDLDLGLAPFLESPSGNYRTLLRDAPGGAGEEAIVSGCGRLTTPLLDHLDIAIWGIDPKNPLAKAPIIGAEAVRVRTEEPVLIDHWKTAQP